MILSAPLSAPGPSVVNMISDCNPFTDLYNSFALTGFQSNI